MTQTRKPLVVVVPAAGVGKRMLTACPKQYLEIAGKTVIEHTVERLLAHDEIAEVIIALGEHDEYFVSTTLASNSKVSCVVGGQERVDSVLAGLQHIDIKKYQWVLVHDAARPCFQDKDLSQLIKYCYENDHGGILAAPVRDTMKLANDNKTISKTIDRSVLWHALTPQMYQVSTLLTAITKAKEQGGEITDESSAIEQAGFTSGLVEGSSDNIKITRPEDLTLAQFILAQQKKTQETTCV
jgi:2-C-methyl-D-erythritol 4-phosphate cytidylyltransferase